MIPIIPPISIDAMTAKQITSLGFPVYVLSHYSSVTDQYPNEYGG
ncbi:hypothetical protein L3N51_01436 [Metallosphaera sp. J1]|nr:hypothetical protein [Metallosphaera javensis (ex Hofmann et al. 2022)]MCG3109146.1 hypothetical protein [Metallosphaera javensis (ex Hofmann et al. 2022)]